MVSTAIVTAVPHAIAVAALPTRNAPRRGAQPLDEAVAHTEAQVGQDGLGVAELVGQTPEHALVRVRGRGRVRIGVQ
eukprot:scaffold14692_cov55-Phaeocystis_antarctica.AAC.1